MGEWNFGHEPPNTFDNETWTSGYEDDFYMQEGKLLSKNSFVTATVITYK